MINVGIVGHTGRLGKPLLKILENHPQVKIVYTESRKEGVWGNKSDADFIFLALPYGESENYLPSFKGKKIIDLSIDHRLDKGWVYGLPELNKDKIKNAERIANPGCYATAILEALSPVKNLVSDIKIKAYSGVSGRSEQKINKKNGIERYAKAREHPQVAEVEKYLGKPIESFEPHIVYSLKTGIFVKIEAKLRNQKELDDLFKNSFADKPFLKLVDFQDSNDVDTKHLEKIISGVVNSNFCQVSFCLNKKSIIITSALDNLIKGGSGQAVQNFNLVYGLDEKTGLI
ncbi:MAG: hypothetical protein AAB514_03390 [Patescibacteria group bacterium]